MKLHENDYVIVDKNYNPIKTLDICYGSKESIKWELYNSTMTEEEIDRFIFALFKTGIGMIDENTAFVSMTKLPSEIQQQYINYYKTINLK